MVTTKGLTLKSTMSARTYMNVLYCNSNKIPDDVQSINIQ